MVFRNDMIKFTYGFISALLLSVITHFYICSSNKTVIGKAELMQTVGLNYFARIDTGASVTSIHAYDITIENGSEDKAKNIGKIIRFTSSNEKDESIRVESRIVDVKKVRNAQGVEYRYVVELPITWHGDTLVTKVNLRDRSQMSYKLLIGRNWLEGRHIVDVNYGTTINSATKAK